MAKEIGQNTFEWEDGDMCPRGSSNALDPGQQPCTGRLYRESNHQAQQDLMRCAQCDYSWKVTYRLPLTPNHQKGKAPTFKVIPDRLVNALAQASFERAQALRVPDPRKRALWSDGVEQEAFIRGARESIEPVWPVFVTWFEEFFGIGEPAEIAEKSARIAIEEIAIPTLERYEERFDTPDTPRVALQAILNAR